MFISYYDDPLLKMCLALRSRSRVLFRTEAVACCSTPRRSLHSVQNSYPLPWPLSHQQNTHSNWNKLAGIFLLKQLVPFSHSEFLQGVKDAVYTIADAISNKSRHSELEYLLTKRLYAAVKPSLDQLPSVANVHLDIESLRYIKLCTIQGTIGEALPEDEYAVKLLGQTLVASEASLEMYSDVFFRGSKEDRMEASEAVLTMKANFELGVTFSTQEKYVVFGEDGQVINGSNKIKSCQHLWKFSSPIYFEREQDGRYPIDWTVSDINNFLSQKDC